MVDQLVHPNLHVALLHFPLALLVSGAFIELFSFLWRAGSFRIAGRWMILLGALACIPVTFSGIYALEQIARTDNPAGDGYWIDVKSQSPVFARPDAWNLLRNHALYQSIACALCAGAVVIWLASSDRVRRSFHWVFMAALLLGVVIILRAAGLGGQAVFTRAVGVQLDWKLPAQPASDPDTPRWERYVSPVELHVIAAGFAVAFAVAAIGLSFRKITATYEVRDTRPIIPREQTMAGTTPRTPASESAMMRSFNPDIEVMVQPFAPAGRIWLLGFLLALITAALGVFLFAEDSHAFARAAQLHQPVWTVLWDQIKPVDGKKLTRELAHVAMGGTIVVVPLILAGLARFAPRRKFWLCVFTGILVLAVSAQIWLGILLLLDTSDGPVTRFNPSQSAATP